MGFFGVALKCDDASFLAKFGTGFSTDMTAVHKSPSFQKPVNKAAFEFFNQAAIDVLARAGVSNDDLKSVAQFLDAFRAQATGAKATDVVCQDADCTSSPFGVKVQPAYFNPSYMTVPHGTVVSFFKDDLSPHIISESAGNGTNVRLISVMFLSPLTSLP